MISMFRHCEYVSNIIKRSTLGWYFTPIPWIDSNSACPPKKTNMNIEDHGTFRIYVFSMVQQEFYGTSYKNDIYIYTWLTLNTDYFPTTRLDSKQCWNWDTRILSCSNPAWHRGRGKPCASAMAPIIDVMAVPPLGCNCTIVGRATWGKVMWHSKPNAINHLHPFTHL